MSKNKVRPSWSILLSLKPVTDGVMFLTGDCTTNCFSIESALSFYLLNVYILSTVARLLASTIFCHVRPGSAV